MLSRRLLRVKVVQMAYAHHQKGEVSIQQTENELFHSIAKSHEMYHAFLLLMLELKNFAENRIELRKQKKRPSEEDLNPNMRFVDNGFLVQLANNESLLAYNTKNGTPWADHPETIKALFNIVSESALYTEYMSTEAGDYEADKRFAAKLLEKVIAPFESLYTMFEEQSVYWNDEIEFVISMVVKTIKGFKQENESSEALLPEFKDDEDRDFVQRLCRKTLVNQTDNMNLIQKFTKNWDFDRVAYLDVVLMQVAIAEIVEFKNIPINVSLNEYIEIAKFYSTNKSGVFINGVLDKITEHLIDEKVINKPGKVNK
ncbi:transcription antitermination factor NusB [Carboxylicivirga marina]|uniref:Transcription antitermination factor NusB n=1 Tax=Carboxylicivirga marina TaxID=2800988 RepID=A0ABS1HNT9_9BACT|nr:transcription antitermination factor NusB [Carboxylicivirga marina]MBK3519351.1 transcription antitermination factor NusB [Carboxylicivirga marina]